MSVQQAGKDVIKPLGDLVPIVGGLELSSAISFQCMFLSFEITVEVCLLIQFTLQAREWPIRSPLRHAISRVILPCAAIAMILYVFHLSFLFYFHGRGCI
jgi:hypothetical protein